MHLRNLLVFFLALAAFPPHNLAEVSPAKKPLPLRASIQDKIQGKIQDKNFQLLSLFQTNPKLRNAITSDNTLKQINSTRHQHLLLALQTCQQDPACTLQPLMWTDEEITAVSSALTRIYQSNPHVRKILDGELQSSGTYVLYQQQDELNLLGNAWALCARGLNEVLTVYGEGARPHYPKIDSISFATNSPGFRQQVASLTQQAAQEPHKLFFEPSLKIALQLLILNRRDEAGRFEPMEKDVNKAALQAIPSTHWDHYAFSVIVVPGEGPEDPTIALDEVGRKRTALAAQAYHEGKAPFILVSGGYVHPSQTRFSEAIEMKKALLRDYHVPEEAILVDPHARHTTTNMRNAVREIYRYGMPMDKPALVVSTPSQITYIHSSLFADRCRAELGYVPYQITTQPSDTSLVFLPKIESLQQNPLDPLDP